MNTNLILTLIGLAITVIGGITGLLISLFSKIRKLEGRLETLAASSNLAVRTERTPPPLMPSFPEIEPEVEALRQEKVKTRQVSLEVPIEKLKQTAPSWWSSLEEPWQAIFRKAIGVWNEPTETELETILSLTQLDCRWNHLTSLEPLRALTGLQSLNCIGNHLTSLEPLQACTGLQTLNCSHNQLTSLEGLQACTGLQTLVCYLNQLTNLEPLQACTNLQTLECSLNQLTSLEPLHGLKSLKELECGSNPSLSQPEIERFLTKNRRCWWSSLYQPWQAIFKKAIGIKSEPTEKELLTILSLTQLDCHEKELTTLEPLRALTGLQTLVCYFNRLTNLEPLQVLTSLQSLNCSYNYLTSLEPLQALTGLQTLNCSHNRLTNLEPLQACTSLQSLVCHNNTLTSLEPLSGLESLKKLSCVDNPSLSESEIERFHKIVHSRQEIHLVDNGLIVPPPVDKLTENRWCWWSSLDQPWQAIFKAAIRINREPTTEELEIILNLTTLQCKKKGLTSLEPLRELTGLQQLDCENNHLTSLEPLRACVGLQSLNCWSNQLTSLEGLQACPDLQTLDCGFNQLTSLEPLRACTGLRTLVCHRNQLTSLEPLHDLKSLKRLDCRSNPSLSQPELQRFLITNRRCWWSSLGEQWQAIFKDAIGIEVAIRIESEPTEDELVTILSLTELNCSRSALTHLEPLRALTGLQTLDCRDNQLTSLEPLHGLKNLKKLECGSNPSLSEPEIERFKTAVPSCEVKS